MAAAKKIEVVVNPTLAGFRKPASYKGDLYYFNDGEVYNLPEKALMYRTKHFGSVVPSFVRKEAYEAGLPEDDGTITE